MLAEVGAGVGLWPNAMRALEPIGLAGKVAQLAVTVARQGLRRPDGTWLMCIPGELMAQAVGGRVRHRFTGPSCSSCWPPSSTPRSSTSVPAAPAFEDSGQGVTARFADGRQVQADVLIGADGVHSIVRAALARACSAPVPRLHRRAVGHARGISSAAPRRHRDLGPRRTLRPGTHQRRTDHLVRDMECRGGRAARRGHRSALARALRRLARSHTRHHRSHPADRCDPERYLRPAPGQDLEPGTGGATRRCHPPDDPRTSPRAHARRSSTQPRWPPASQAHATPGRHCGNTSSAGGATPPPPR